MSTSKRLEKYLHAAVAFANFYANATGDRLFNEMYDFPETSRPMAKTDRIRYIFKWIRNLNTIKFVTCRSPIFLNKCLA